MSKKNRTHQRKKIILPEPGSSPGTLYIATNALETQIILHSYNNDFYESIALGSLSELAHRMEDKSLYYWVDIKGFKSVRLFKELEKTYNINTLVIEDITRSYERPKIEEYPNYVFAISRILDSDENNHLINEQLSFILKKNILFTFKESYDPCFSAVINRLVAGKGNIRTAGSSYLMYAIMDNVVDVYFKILNSIGEELDEIEDKLLDRPDRSIMFDTQLIKRKIITIRRVAWPERDKLNDIIRSDSDLITDQTKMFMKDAYDHCIQIIDIIESLKEIAANNIDMYLSVISNRMNEIMKVLTIISSIFIPLTFIAGIYGMNFARIDPVTNKVMPYNMPELYSDRGYVYIIGIMIFIALLQIVYFWRKGWFR